MVDEEGKDTGNGDEPITHTNLDLSRRTLEPHECDLNGHIFEGETNFKGTTFLGHANFEGATFKNGADFSNARFQAGASFEEAKFLNEGDVWFDSARFSGKLPIFFFSTVFENDGHVSFGHTIFDNDDGVSFISARFNNGDDVSFHSATFKNTYDISFTSAKFHSNGDIQFDSARFENKGDVSFKSARFENEGKVTFEHTRFTNEGDVSFDSVRFENTEYVLFGFASFANNGSLSFGSARFKNSGDVFFYYTGFKNKGVVWFESARFENNGDVSFDRANFNNNSLLYFSRVLFVNDGGLLFSVAEYGDKINATFRECQFLSNGNILFSNARHPEKGSLVFQRCHFEPTGNVNFTGALFRHTMFEGGKVEWISDLLKPTKNEKKAKEKKKEFSELPDAVKKLIKNRKESFHTAVFHGDAVVLFKDLTPESAKHLTFRLTDLSRAKFDGMTLSHIQLNAPTWLKVGLRQMLYEEYEFRESHKKKPKWERFKMYFSKLPDEKKMQLKNLENQYTQLKTNLERQGDYYNSGHFHYGEQEMRRKGFYWLGRLFGLTHVYKLIAGYGEKPQRAGLSALALLLITSITIIFLKGLEGGMAVGDLLQIKDWYQVTVSIFKTSVGVITPFSWRGEISQITGSNWWHYAVLIIGQILLYVQIPLFIMAVRRRFKR